MSGKPYTKPEDQPEPDEPRRELCQIPGCGRWHVATGPSRGD